jgi:hypothetical protein
VSPSDPFLIWVNSLFEADLGGMQRFIKNYNIYINWYFICYIMGDYAIVKKG